MSTEGRVREWHAEDGRGVIASEETPNGCWAHFSGIRSDGHAELHAGDVVAFTYEGAEQAGYQYRAVDVWPPGVDQSTTARSARMTDPRRAYRSTLTLRRDDTRT